MRLSETDEIAAELYLVPPARFVAARDQVVRQARAAGHRDLARELQALRRPTLSAWLVNVLTRHRRDRMQQLFAVGRELRQAQTRLDADQLRRLPAQREDLIAELLDWARRHAAEAGVQPTEAALSEVEGTLQAGLVDLARGRRGDVRAPGPADVPRRLRPAAAGGVGRRPVGAIAPDPGPAPDEPAGWRMWPVEDELGRRRERSGRGGDQPNGRMLTGGRRLRTARRTAARPAPVDPAETLRRAEADFAKAASDHWQREHDLAEAEAAMQEVRDRQELLEQQRMQLRRDKVAAEQDLAAARAAQRAALRELTAARRALETAERRVRPPGDRPPAPDRG